MDQLFPTLHSGNSHHNLSYIRLSKIEGPGVHRSKRPLTACHIRTIITRTDIKYQFNTNLLLF